MSTNVEERPNCSRSSVRPRATCAPKAWSRRPMRSCIPGSKNNRAGCWPRSRRCTHEQHCPQTAERPACARWETWLGYPPRSVEPPLRIVLVLDHLAGHLSYDLVRWLFEHGVMPLYTPVGGRLSQHGRVGATHHRPPSAHRSASHKRPANH